MAGGDAALHGDGGGLPGPGQRTAHQPVDQDPESAGPLQHGAGALPSGGGQLAVMVRQVVAAVLGNAVPQQNEFGNTGGHGGRGGRTLGQARGCSSLTAHAQLQPAAKPHRLGIGIGIDIQSQSQTAGRIPQPPPGHGIEQRPRLPAGQQIPARPGRQGPLDRGLRTIEGLELPLPLTNGSGSSRPSICLLYTSPSPRDATLSRMPSSA